MMQAARVLDRRADADATILPGARRRAEFRLHLDARHRELVRIEQRLASADVRRVPTRPDSQPERSKETARHADFARKARLNGLYCRICKDKRTDNVATS